MWVSSSNLKKERRDTMKKRTFIIKVLRLIAIILLLLTLLVIAIKKWHYFIDDWVSKLLFRGDIHLQIRMFLFFIIWSFLHTYTYLVACMGLEPMNVTLRGWCVNHFTNRPKLNLYKYSIIKMLFLQHKK